MLRRDASINGQRESGSPEALTARQFTDEVALLSTVRQLGAPCFAFPVPIPICGESCERNGLLRLNMQASIWATEG
jgi:hypothetical protein